MRFGRKQQTSHEWVWIGSEPYNAGNMIEKEVKAMMSSTCPDSTCRLRDRFGYCASSGPCIAVSNTVRVREDENKLKPCPFCGEKAVVTQIPYGDETPIKAHPEWSWQNPGMWMVGCNTYACFGNINHHLLFWSEKEARNAWNWRKG